MERPVAGRVTLPARVSPSLLDALNAAAAERGVTLRWLVEALLREGLANLRPADDFRLTTPGPPRFNAGASSGGASHA